MMVECNAGSDKGSETYNREPLYAIRIKGHLDHGWSEWLGHLVINHEEGGTTLLIGPVADPPAMYGLLIKLRDLGLSLISINLWQANPAEPAQGEAGDPVLLAKEKGVKDE